MAEGWFHESWEGQMQQRNAESSYDGVAALVLLLRRAWASRQIARLGRGVLQRRQAGTGASRCLSSVARPIGLRLSCLWLLCIVSRRCLLCQKIVDFFEKQSAADRNDE